MTFISIKTIRKIQFDTQDRLVNNFIGMYLDCDRNSFFNIALKSLSFTYRIQVFVTEHRNHQNQARRHAALDDVKTFETLT